MLLVKIREGIIALNPKNSAYFKKSLHINERLELHYQSNPPPTPGMLTKIILKRRDMKRSIQRSSFGQVTDLIKTKHWLMRLKISKWFQDLFYLSYHRKRRHSWYKIFLFGFIFGFSQAYGENNPGGVVWTVGFQLSPKTH